MGPAPIPLSTIAAVSFRRDANAGLDLTLIFCSTNFHFFHARRCRRCRVLVDPLESIVLLADPLAPRRFDQRKKENVGRIESA
jgi:hypothetical protein